MAKQNINFRLKDSLVLNQYILNMFGTNSFSSFSQDLKDSVLEGYDENNISRLHHELIGRMFSNQSLTKEKLLEYDQNIYSHTRRIIEKQHKEFTWKYFQYLALLFTEVYLDKYFSGQQYLLNELNDFYNESGANQGLFEDKYFSKDDLNKIAYWNATGSGKTLIMHVNILQYLFYLKKNRRERELNRIILLTPNEGLSKQHLKELNKSGFEAELFSKAGTSLFRGEKIEIIDIHKLEEKEGEKTVAVESFEGNNLVLVDEGHRGAGGDDWKVKRDRLSESGFSFEYSATFGQAVSAASGSKKAALLHEYSKCTLFDYSYKYFYEDGYGKDYSILNLNDTWNQHTFQLYLTACLLNYFQQLKIFSDDYNAISKFMLEKPLLIFVGSKVTAIRKESGNQVSDVIQILEFVRDFIKKKDEYIRSIETLLMGDGGLLDKNNNPVFRNTFTYLITIRQSPEDIYDDMLIKIFNSKISGAELHLDNLKGADGEIGLRVGDSDYFGVINVGDDKELLKLCAQKGFHTSEKDFSDSLFHNINNNSSRINVLIGSKKFSEGWNSWRVSTMGLMNVGRGEGTEIIQLFGRGVRLKGYNFSLKRSDRLDAHIKPDVIPKQIKKLETLYVFGVRADYMQQFKEYLEEEGLPQNDSNFVEITLPVLPAVELIENKKLKIVKVKEGINFKKDVQFELLPPVIYPEVRLLLDWYPKIQILGQAGRAKVNYGDFRKEGKLETHHLAFINWDEIYFEIQKFKNERNWYNMSVSRDVIKAIASDPSWYTLFIPDFELMINNFNQVMIWQQIVTALIKGYCDKIYNHEKNKYLSKYLETTVLTPEHPNFINEYTIYIEKTEDEIVEKIRRLKEEIKDPAFSEPFRFARISDLNLYYFNQHLYKPLLYLNSNKFGEVIRVSPFQLVESEKTFIEQLKKFHDEKPDYFEGKELFLLRNLSRKGVGFFEANNFYPDFILWLVTNEKQYVNFIDPKGLRQINGLENPKVNFHNVLQNEIQPKLNDNGIKLNSFILSITPMNQLTFWKGIENENDFENNNILFMTHHNYLEKLFTKILGEG